MSRQKRPDSQARFLDLWERNEEFGRAVGCVATTYTFDAGFFEEECLTRFAGIDSDPAEDLAAYLVEREEKLADVFACALVDQGHVSPQRSLRWHLLPVRVPGGGVQHAKVSLLVWERLSRVLVGSCNLTKPGYRENFENLAVLDFTADGETPIAVLRDVLAFLETVQGMTPGLGATAGPQRAMRDFLGVVRSQTADWQRSEWPRNDTRAVFVPVAPGGPTLFAQVSERVWDGTGPSTAWVLSPFFDQGDNCRPTVEALEAILGRNGERTIWFMGAGNRWPDGTIDLEMPAVLTKPWLRRVRHEFAVVKTHDNEGNRRALHAKSLWLEREYEGAYLIGSSNFTAAGTGVAGERGNVEANVAYRLPNIGSAFAHRCEDAYPPYEELATLDGVTLRQSQPDETPDPEAYMALPAAFGSALFHPDGTAGVVELEILPSAPAMFRVRSQAGALLLDGSDWRKQGSPVRTKISWTSQRPPSALEVEWDGGEPVAPRRSWWVVNVTDTSRLPPPEELRNLPLQLLLEILSSARPLHEAVMAARRRVTKGVRLPDELDPHRKVDTSQYLLRRVKRVSVALEGLRQRLERPAFSLDALRWRLEGPVGPLALARQIASEEPRAAAFLIAEIVMLLRRTDLSRLRDVLGAKVVAAEISRVTALLREIGAAQPAPPAVAAYVSETVTEAGR